MQAIQSFFTATAPDREPTAAQQQQQQQQQQQEGASGGLLSAWESYARGEAQPAPTDRLLASAEEGAVQGEAGGGGGGCGRGGERRGAAGSGERVGRRQHPSTRFRSQARSLARVPAPCVD